MTCNTSTTVLRAALVAAALLLCSCTATATPNHGMQFHPSSFLVNSGSNAAPHGIAVPVTIQLVDSEGRADTSDSSVVVTASVSGGSISGNVATVQNGVARFMMTFTSCTGGVVTFTAHSANGAAVSGKTLMSGAISVTPVPNSELLFDAASPLQVGQPAVATAGSAIPAFKINLYDSCGNVDTSMTGLTISASATSGASLSGATTATFTDGVAIFSGLTVANSETTQLTFTVGKSVTPVAASSKKLTTGVVTVQPKASLALSHSAMAIVFVGVCVAMLAAAVIASGSKKQTEAAKYIIVATSSSAADSTCAV